MASVNANVVKHYKDIDLNFNITSSGDILTLTQEDSVKQALRNNVLTNFNERCFLPHFGCGVTQNMFELADNVIGIEIKESIKESLKNYEPRVNIINIIVSVKEHNIEVQIEFRIINIPKVLSLDIDIERIR